MKFLAAVSLASLTLVDALVAPRSVSYDGWKVYRVNVGENRSKLKDVVSGLQLGTWKGSVDTSDIVDVMVAPTQIQKFEAETKNIDTAVMHEDLGASISEETSFTTYAGKLSPEASILPELSPDTDQHQQLD
jgi:carboxypeptidase A4